MLHLTFGQKIFFSVLGVSALSVILVAVPMLFNTAAHYKQIASNQAKTDVAVLANMIGPSIVFEREDMAENLLELLEDSDNVLAATVYAPDSINGGFYVFAEYGEQQASQGFVAPTSLASSVTEVNGNLSSLAPIYAGGDVVGYIHMTISLDEIRQHFIQTLIYVLAAAVFSLLVAFYLAYASRRSIVKPVKDLHKVTNLIAETKDYSRRAVAVYEDEVGDLIHSFNQMLGVIEGYDAVRKEKEFEILQLNQNLERKVDERTIELQQNMAVLNKAIVDLRETQGKLVEQEKMASLGSLVAGVAHEINTPIGVGITASSHLNQSVLALQEKFVSGSLTKRDFTEAVAEMIETVTMISKNLERSAALVKSFKMVAVDQSSEDTRLFNVKEYVENVLMSLKPKLKRTRHTVTLDVPDNLNIYSSPGAFSQIITNLIMNSLIHGFEAIESGDISIKIALHDADLIMSYFDNGKGIPAHIRNTVFDPFVTTARNKGGSGLGTHILYNLVTQVLGGTVTLEDDVTEGVHFRIQFPLQSPDAIVHSHVVGAK
jgi:signal transduction histidine kinase